MANQLLSSIINIQNLLFLIHDNNFIDAEEFLSYCPKAEIYLNKRRPSALYLPLTKEVVCQYPYTQFPYDFGGMQGMINSKFSIIQ